MKKEHFVAIRDLPKVLEAMGFPRPHEAVGYRWASKGARGRKLRTVMAGGKRFTRVGWIHDFLFNNSSEEGNTSSLSSESERVEQAHKFLGDEGF